MDDHIPAIGSKIARSWVKPPTRLDPTTLDALVAQFRAVSRIAEAWLVGSRITPSDGTNQANPYSHRFWPLPPLCAAGVRGVRNPTPKEAPPPSPMPLPDDADRHLQP